MNSKFSYIACGISVVITLLCAFLHLGLLLIINGFFAVFNWYIGEIRRKMEECELIEEYELSKQAQNKPNE